MRRLSMTFAAVGAALLLALGLLVTRALESVAEERELRHQAVAERIFDEMERELTELVEREEARPFEHYLYDYVPSSSPSRASGRSRSPLADLPEVPYVVGYFQIDPGGRVSTPHFDPNDAEAASETQRDVDRRVAAIVAGAESPVASDLRREPSREAQSPGTTRSVDSKDENVQSSAYLESFNELNRGALERGQRVSKMSQVATSNVGPLSEQEAADREAFPIALDAVDVVLDSMEGRRAGEEHLLLVRRASTNGTNGAVFEQGLVIDVPRLIAWLDATVLARSDLGGLAEVVPGLSELEVGRGAAWTRLSPSVASSGRIYRRRFAEPFAEVTSVLGLAPLPDATGVRYVYWLSALLGLAVTAGLLGLYRMVAVKLAFAERQRNFVSAVTHELKTPLTAIRMYGEMLRDGLVTNDEKKKQYYEVITSESERLTRLVGNVLELSRLERRHRTLRPMAGPLAPVLEEIVEVLGPHAREEGFTLRVETEDGLPPAVFDSDALAQVLFNLVDNALKYGKHASRSEITVRARRAGDGAPGVVVSVSDNGPGIGAEHLIHVFEPFYRGESELTRSSKGTGIGLALVRGLVEEMGGRVEGRNAAGGGFEVSLHLPAG